MSKCRKEFRLQHTSIRYLERFAGDHCGGNLTAALEQIIMEHATRNTVEADQRLAQQVADLVCEKLDATLVRIRLGSNGADRNSQILIELLNGLYAYNDIPSLVSTQQLTTPAVEEARRVVKERIENFRIKQLERKQKKGE